MTASCLFARNTRPLDRALRLLAGGVAIAAAAAPRITPLSYGGSAAAAALGAVGVVLVVTGATARCPLYAVTGRRPCAPTRA